MSKAPPMPGLPPQRLNIDRYISINFEGLPWNCKHSCPVHTMPGKFEKGVNHSENTSNVFRPHFVGEI